MRRFLMILGLLLVPMTAWAGSWYKNCISTDTTGWIQPGEYACYQPASKNDDSVALNVRFCENIDILYSTDINADGTASSTTVNVMSCPNSTASANSCFVIENVTLDGDPATNTEAIYGAGALFIYADMQNDGTINDPQLTVICHGPK